MKIKNTLLCLLLLISFDCISQESKDSLYTIETNQGEVLNGRLVKITQDSIVLDNSLLGMLSIPRASIKKMGYGAKVFTPSKDYESDPFFVPTARTNGAGKHYYKNYWIFGHLVNGGITDNLDLSFGMETVSLFSGADIWPVIHLGAKYGTDLSEHVSIGMASKILFNNEGGIGILSMPITVGEKRTNITIAPTYAVAFGEDESALFFAANFNLSFSRKIRLVTDAVYADNTLVFTSMAEIDIKGKVALLFGFIATSETGGSIPNIGLNVPFGQW